jgi:hypothetical protein
MEARVTIDEARERVARGAALLDEKEPGWRQKVNPELLEMRSECGCIIGQALDDPVYARGLLRLGIDEEDEDSRHGFDVSPGEGWSWHASYELLQQAWLELLVKP